MLVKILSVLMAIFLFTSTTGGENKNIYNCVDYSATENFFLRQIEADGLTDYILYDSSELTAEMLAARNGITIIERCIGVVTNKTAGDGKLLKCRRRKL